jgi:hypothetical protein
MDGAQVVQPAMMMAAAARRTANIPNQGGTYLLESLGVDHHNRVTWSARRTCWVGGLGLLKR